MLDIIGSKIFGGNRNIKHESSSKVVQTSKFQFICHIVKVRPLVSYLEVLMLESVFWKPAAYTQILRRLSE
jgi:hypothetical protein